MNNWYNKHGKPLSSFSWLNAHFFAKQIEREKFVKQFSKIKPLKIVDIGCGPGLWLDTYNKFIDNDCDFVGIDIDNNVINEAINKSKDWKRKSNFIISDVENEPNIIPKADLFILYNTLSYIKHPDIFINHLKNKLLKNGKISIRQFDGSLIRFGPMPNKIRMIIDNSLKNSVLNSSQFSYYDMDRIFEILQKSNFKTKNISFELFYRSSPFPDSFLEYYKNTVEWTICHISENAANELKMWYDDYIKNINSSYFISVDLIALLS